MLLRFRMIMTFIQSGISLLQWELTVTSLLDNVQDRVGCSHLAYLFVPYMGNLPHFAVGLL